MDKIGEKGMDRQIQGKLSMDWKKSDRNRNKSKNAEYKVRREDEVKVEREGRVK